MRRLPFANDTITIFNRYQYLDKVTNKITTKWLATVLNNCYWGKESKQVMVGDILVGSNDYIVQIPQDDKYIDKCYWQGDTGHYTADKGDIIVKGKVTDTIPINGSEGEILGKYEGNAFKVTDVKNNTGKDVPLGHIAVKGR